MKQSDKKGTGEEPACRLCAIKHLGQALVLLDEALLGYPSHRLRAYGHMAEAERELVREPCFRALAETIRNERVKTMEDASYYPELAEIMDMLDSQ